MLLHNPKQIVPKDQHTNYHHKWGQNMARDIQLDLGINGAFITRRWEEPDNWMRLTRELGYDHHEFCADVIDPFFSGDREYQMQTAR